MYRQLAKGCFAHQGETLRLKHPLHRWSIIATVPDVKEPGNSSAGLLHGDCADIERVDRAGKKAGDFDVGDFPDGFSHSTFLLLAGRYVGHRRIAEMLGDRFRLFEIPADTQLPAEEGII